MINVFVVGNGTGTGSLKAAEADPGILVDFTGSGVVSTRVLASSAVSTPA